MHPTGTDAVGSPELPKVSDSKARAAMKWRRRLEVLMECALTWFWCLWRRSLRLAKACYFMTTSSVVHMARSGPADRISISFFESW
jgi:hypothetical protein